jgi:CO/xanthine dehydrogenase Mo-binding subunit
VTRNVLTGFWLACLLAVHDAIGVRITEIPITPERILRALGKVKD